MIRIAQFTFTPFGEQTYVVHDADTREAAIIDPGCSTPREWESLRTHVAREGLHVQHILLTHAHLDHVAGTGLCVREYATGLAGSLDDQLSLPTPREQAFLFGMDGMYDGLPVQPSPITVRLRDGDHFLLGTRRVDVIDVPGHSPHGLCYYFADEKAIFTGDVLFNGSIGRTDFGPRFGCSHRSLVEGITSRLLTLPADVSVYPGHGPQTSIGFEATYNPWC